MLCVLIGSGAVLALSLALAIPARARLANDRDALARVPAPSMEASETPLDPEMEAISILARTHGPDWTGTLASLERSLPAPIRLERIAWRNEALTVRLVADEERVLREAEGALARVSRAVPVSQSVRDGQLVAEFELKVSR